MNSEVDTGLLDEIEIQGKRRLLNGKPSGRYSNLKATMTPAVSVEEMGRDIRLDRGYPTYRLQRMESSNRPLGYRAQLAIQRLKLEVLQCQSCRTDDETERQRTSADGSVEDLNSRRSRGSSANDFF